VLGPLDDDALHALIGSLALPAAPDAALQARLASHCGGNPLFLLETIKHLALHPPAAPGQALPLPSSVETALAGRLAALSPPALALLRVAAVAGGDSHPALAADVLGSPLAALADPWREAEGAQLLRDDGVVHEALRAAVLAGLPRVLRGALHERVAFGLQRRAAPAAAVAPHFEAAGLWPAAGRAWQLAAADARRLGRTAERLAHLLAAARAFDATADAAAAFDARVAAIAARLACDGPDAALADAAALRPQARVPAQRVALQLAQAEVALGAYRCEQAAEAAAAALAEAEPAGDAALQARMMQAAALAMQGQVAAALDHMLPLRPRLEATADPVQAAMLWSQWAIVQHGAGDPAACAEAGGRRGGGGPGPSPGGGWGGGRPHGSIVGAEATECLSSVWRVGRFN
jgi:hypothetical protein